MKIQTFQHVPFESPGHILEVCRRAGYQVENTRLFQNEAFPDPETFDVLIIMGGPMSVNDEGNYPWLIREKQFIKNAIDLGRIVFGFCLGAQLIACALGAEVMPGNAKEIGWFPVVKSSAGNVPGFLPDVITVFHWHGDTFDLPDGARLLYSSEATPNQAFLYGDNVAAFQFHPEMTMEGINGLVNHCSDELTSGRYIMSGDELLGSHGLYHANGYRMIEHLFRYYIPDNKG